VGEDVRAGNMRLTFEAGELFALLEMAKKYNTDPGSLLRIGGLLVVEADRLGLFKFSDPGSTAAALLGKKD